MKYLHRWFSGLLLVGSFLLAGCTSVQSIPTAMFTSSATPTDTPSPTLTPKPQNPDDWQQLQPGLERRILEIREDEQHLDSLYILRLAPHYFRFEVAYHPQGLTLDQWQAQTDAFILVNGGFFQQDGELYIPTGLTIIDGQSMGASYGDFGGMFAVAEDGPDLRWLTQQPYDPDESLSSALQSFPILVKPGGELGFPAEHEDNLSARRTVIAQDQEGRILLMVAPGGNLTLHQLSAALTNSNLNLEIAMNLDGGPSSGILLKEPSEIIPAISPLPIVITVYTQ